MVSIKRRNQTAIKCSLQIVIRLLKSAALLLVFSPMLWFSYGLYYNYLISDADVLDNNWTANKFETTVSLIETSNRKTEKYSNVPAYVVSLIKCKGDDSTVGFLDAAVVLRHSVHKNSIHYPGSSGRYGYKMYAIIHQNCAHHAPTLESVGYEAIIKGTPIDRQKIKNEFYRKTVEAELCCGSAEFIKMYAYTLTKHPVVVHFDLDKIVMRPMDDLFDAIIYDFDSPKGMAARKNIEVEWPEDILPEKIDAFFTRDYTLSWPWKKIAGVQGGLLVIRPNEAHFHQYMDIILEGNYTAGFNNDCGWGGLGYGGWIGAKAFQGIVAYFYGHFHPGTAVELDVCKWNQVAADVIWRGPRGKDSIGECNKYPRNDDHKSNYPRAPGEPNVKNNGCDDCRVTPIDQLKTIHYTACKKPWSCPTARTNNNDKTQRSRIDTELTDFSMCMLLHKEWFKIRKEFEELHYAFSKNDAIFSRNTGKYNVENFLGYCEDEGKYLSMIFPNDNFNIKRLYPHET